MDDIKKAAPPIPRDALKQPSHEVESPFDVISSAPKPEAPKAKQKLAMPEWLGRPILHPDHSQQLEMNAAINEFGLKMPRQQAEDQAYKDYLYHPKTGQYAQAARHHLTGMKAADAAGDKEAARKHRMMYDMHAKALNKDPYELARELGSGEGQDMPKVYKFKAHKGDAFALQPPPSMSHDLQPSGVYSSSPKPELTKAQQEKLHELYRLSAEALKKAESEWKILPKGHGHLCWVSGCRTVGEAKVERNGKRYCMKHAKEKGYTTPVETKKGEASPNKHIKHPGHCHCNAYKFCHRYGGGRCNAVKP